MAGRYLAQVAWVGLTCSPSSHASSSCGWQGWRSGRHRTRRTGPCCLHRNWPAGYVQAFALLGVLTPVFAAW